MSRERDLVEIESGVHHFHPCFDSFVTQPSSHPRLVDFHKRTERAEGPVRLFHRGRVLIVLIDDHIAQVENRREKTKDRHLHFTLDA